jgi:hypothetical protein
MAHSHAPRLHFIFLILVSTASANDSFTFLIILLFPLQKRLYFHGRIISIFIRHIDIHQNNFVKRAATTLFEFLFHFLHSLHPITGIFAFHIQRFYQSFQHKSVVEFVIHYQRLRALAILTNITIKFLIGIVVADH